MKKLAKHIKARVDGDDRYLRCTKCGEEIKLEVDTGAMEGMMDQMNKFTSKHLKCKGKK